MSAGPLRQTAAVLGLFALVPVLLQLAVGAITPIDAAVRAVAVWIVAVLLGNAARLVLTRTLHLVESRHTRRSSDSERRHDVTQEA